MHLALTFALVAVLTTAMVAVRIFWWRIPQPLQTAMTVAAAAVFAIYAAAYLTKWSASSLRVNYLFCWALLAAWEMVLVRFSLLRPRWLSGIAAVVMLFPLLSASVLFPLATALSPIQATTAELGNHIVSVRVPWGAGTAETSGTDLSLYYQPSWMPFARRGLRSARYYNGKCDANAAYAVLQPDHWRVTMVCPAASYLPGNEAISITLPLTRSVLHNPIKEAKALSQ